MPDLRVINSLQDIDKQQWNACFSGEVKNYDYLLAIEESALAGFSFRYLTVWSGNTLQAATPMFLTHYSLDTTVRGAGRKLTTRIKSAFPKLLTLKLACIGSPCTECGVIGFHPQLNEQEKRALLAEMLICLRRSRNHNRATYSALKIFRRPSNGDSAINFKTQNSVPCQVCRPRRWILILLPSTSI